MPEWIATLSLERIPSLVAAVYRPLPPVDAAATAAR